MNDVEPDWIDINQAEAEALATLPGIGPKRAQAIIAFREKNGPFSNLGELLDVKGITSRTVAALAGRAGVAPALGVPADELEASLGPPAKRPQVAESSSLAPDPVDVPAGDEPSSIEPLPDEPWTGERPVLEPGTVAGPVGTQLASEMEAEEQVVAEGEPAPALETAPDVVPAAVEADEWPAPVEIGGDEPEPAIGPTFGAADDADRGDWRPPDSEPETGYVADSSPSTWRVAGCGPAVVVPGLVGAAFGLFLTLAILALFNGGDLIFADAGRLENVDATQETMERDVRRMNQQLQQLTRELATADARAGRLQATIDVFGTRVENVGDAAEDLDAFLEGMRTLLNDLTGATATPSPTFTPRATATPAGDSDGTATPVATRTPRPTGTPFATATP